MNFLLTDAMKEDIEKLTNDIEQIICSNDRATVSCSKSFLTYWIHDEDYGTEFRVAFSPLVITVSRVCFKQRRRGCMTKCINLLEAFAAKYQIKKICIQSVLTTEMMNWCKKNNYVIAPYIFQQEINGVISGDYIKEF